VIIVAREILILGSIAYDSIMEFSGDFNANLTSNPGNNKFNLAVMPHSKHINFGGTSGNISYNLGQIGASVQIITSVGQDFIELGYQKHLEQFPTLSFNGVIHKDLFTASCYIVNDQNHNQFISFHEGAMIRCPQIKLLEQGISSEKIKIASVSPDNPGAMVRWAEELTGLGIPFVFDPGQVTPAFSGEVLARIIPKAFLVIGNEFEISMIQDKLGVDIEGLLALNSRVIITKGEKGSEC
jgi:adenosine kinase